MDATTTPQAHALRLALQYGGADRVATAGLPLLVQVELDKIARYDAALDADQNFRSIHTLAVMGSDAAIRDRNEKAIPAARARFNAALDAIPTAELAAFTAYRKAMRGA